MYDDRPFAAAGSVVDPAAVAIPFEHLVPQPAEMLLVSPLQCVAGRTQALRQNLLVPATAMQYLLQIPLNGPSRPPKSHPQDTKRSTFSIRCGLSLRYTRLHQHS